MRGWHAQAGLSLGNPRLGFVCTAQTAAGDAALEGYYFEADHALAPEDRLRFVSDERGPAFDPAGASGTRSAGRRVVWHSDRAVDIGYNIEHRFGFSQALCGFFNRSNRAIKRSVVKDPARGGNFGNLQRFVED